MTPDRAAALTARQLFAVFRPGCWAGASCLHWAHGFSRLPLSIGEVEPRRLESPGLTSFLASLWPVVDTVTDQRADPRGLRST